MPRVRQLVFVLAAVLVLSTACSTRKPRVTPDIPRPDTSATRPAAGAGSADTTVVQAEPRFGAAGVPESGVSAADLPMDLQELNRAGYLKDVFFDTDKSDLRDDTRELLAANAAWLKAHPSVKLQLEGHCDERNTAEYNLALGWRRVFAVKDYLVSLGVDAGRLGAISYGEERPFAKGSNEAAWAQNRRVHFVITGR